MIFEPKISGHVLEWLHHLYEYVSDKQDEYIFVLPRKFIQEKNLFSWKRTENIRFVYLTEDEERKCNKYTLLRNSLNASIIVRKYVKQENVSEVFFIFLMKFIPFVLFSLPANCKISGVLYRIYLYDSSKKGVRLLLEKLRFILMAQSKKIKKICVLNDEVSPLSFNKCYKTDKFAYLTDPLPIIKGPFENLRKELNIPLENRIFFQFGTIDGRKHSIDVLKAVSLMGKDSLRRKTFIFSGRIDSCIREEFLQRVDALKNETQVILMEGFLSYEKLNNLCYTSDCILTLYDNVNQSSGTIGYAAYFHKYVIGPSKGLLGRLIQKNNLGIVLNEITPESIQRGLEQDFVAKPSNYCDDHSVIEFCKGMLDD